MTTTHASAMTPRPVPEHARRTHHPWPFWACTLVASVLMFANYAVALPLGALLDRLLHPASSSTTMALITSTLCLVTLFTSLGLVSLVSRRNPGGRLRGVGLQWSGESWWLFVLGWAAMAVATVPAQMIALPHGLTRAMDMSSPTMGMPFLPAMIAVMTRVMQALALQALPEELVWRGWLMNCLRKRPVTALMVSCLGFGCLHFLSGGGQQNLTEHLAYCLQAACFAFLGGALALRMRSLWCAVGVHGGLHLTNLLLDYCPHRVTGSGSWLLQATLCLAMGLVALRGHVPARVCFDR